MIAEQPHKDRNEQYQQQDGEQGAEATALFLEHGSALWTRRSVFTDGSAAVFARFKWRWHLS
jgi:hypothetical protein